MMTIGLRVDEGEVDPDWLMEAVPKRITRKQGRNLPKGEIDEDEEDMTIVGDRKYSCF